MTKRKKVLWIVLAAVLALALIGGIVTAVVLHSRTDRNDQRRIAFNAPALTGDYAVVAPASGSTHFRSEFSSARSVVMIFVILAG